MPTERFSRLSEQKKQAIRDAAIKEFASVSFDKVSINKIIQNANISRGSFYTYFEDKQDVLSFIFQDVQTRCNNFMLETLQENQGDVFAALERFLDFCFEIFENKQLFELAKNAFAYYRGSQAFFGIEAPNSSSRMDHASAIMEYIDFTHMRFREVDEFTILTSLAMANLIMTLVSYYQGETDAEVLRERYIRGVELLKHGAMVT